MSSCGVLYSAAGRFYWDDYLEQRRRALRPGAERVLRWFVRERPLDSIRNCAADEGEGERLYQLAEKLFAADLLVCADSVRGRREAAIVDSWGTWGVLPRAFHFGTRSSRTAAFTSPQESLPGFRWKVLAMPPPPAFRSFADRPRLPLPAVDTGTLEKAPLLETLQRRRSDRVFGAEPVQLADAATLLRIAAGPVAADGANAPDVYQTVYKTSPSGGGRHPTDLYVYARAVEGVAPGVYHYDAGGAALERIGGPVPAEDLVRACGDQPWVADAGMLIFYTSVIARNQWKYSSARSYRILLLDVGHLNQTVYLVATALGLKMTFSAAIRDEVVEDMVGCDPATEFAVGVAVVGTPCEVREASMTPWPGC